MGDTPHDYHVLSGGEDGGAYRPNTEYPGQYEYAPELRITTKDVVNLLNETAGVDDLVLASNGDDVGIQLGTVVLAGGGRNPVVETNITQLVTLLNTEQSLVTVTGSGTDKVLPMQRRALGGGVETPVITPASQLAALFSASSLTSTFISAAGGSATEPVELGTVELTGGGLGFTVTSSINSVVSAINGHVGASALVTATGTGTSHVQGLSRTLLRGGEPTILSDVDDVVTLLTGHGLLSAAGSGSTPLQPMERSFLSSSISRTTYAWNHQDRLTGVKMPNGTQHGYSYDYRVRRVQTTRQNGPQAGQATSIVFSGGLSLAEYESAALAPITATSPTVHYMRGPDMGGGVGGMLYSIRGSTLKYSLSNGRGDIVAQSDENAAITWTASYEAYGKRPAETGVNHDKQRANSKDEDPTGLLNEGFRYRDIETGVWLSRDPAGFVDGPNLYAYVKQNPWSKFDPRGLSGKSTVLKLVTKADDAAEASIKKINGRSPIHANWAGQQITPDKLPATIKNRDQILKDYPEGVYYTPEGRANFTPYAKADLKFKPGELTGEMGPDVSAARTQLMNERQITMAQVMEMEKGNTWHHVEGGQGLQLVPSDLHDAYKHTGGRADIKEGNFFSKAGAFFGGIFASRTMEAKETGGNVQAAQNLDAATMLPVIGDGIDVVATGAEITEKKLDNIINQPGNPGTLGYERARMLKELQNEQ